MRVLDCDVVIVGGAVAGASLACHLRDSGLKVLIVEASKEPRIMNRGDGLSAATVERLSALGVVPSLEKRGAIRINQWKAIDPEGGIFAHLQMSEMLPPPFDFGMSIKHHLIEEALIETALSGSAGNVEFIRDFPVTGVLKNDEGRIVGVSGKQGGVPTEVHAKLVAGCDGPQSMVRTKSGLKTNLEVLPYQYFMLTCTRDPSQPGDMLLEIWGKDRFCGIYPVGENTVRCPIQAHADDVTRWKQVGFEAIHRELIANHPVFAAMTPLDHDLHFYRITRHHAEQYCADGLILSGEAAHCTPPYYGMGMTMAVRDGYYVSRLIVDLLKAGKVPTREALLPYEQQCRPFNEFAIEAAMEYGSVAAAGIQTRAGIDDAMERTTAMDPGVIEILFGTFDNRFTEYKTPAEVSSRIAAA
jgi:2-polyprenyl-6-methoxyphenol hydroxylase-like FAD-dependent oxidoreductase